MSAVAVAAVFAAVGCKCQPKPAPKATPTAAVRVVPAEPERVVVVREETQRGDVLRRPDLSDEWVWNGQALPTGDPATSVIKIEKVTPARVNLNAPYDYTIRVTNIATTMHLVDVKVADELPKDGYEFASAVPAAERTADTLHWVVGHLAPGESREMVVHGKATKVGTVRKCATVEYTPNVCVETAVVAPALEIQRFAPAEVVQCDEIPLRFVVRNPGTGNATNVKVVDKLPDGWTVDGRQTLSFDVGTLKPGESRELTAIARTTSAGSFNGVAQATGDGDLRSEAAAPTVVRKPKLEIVAEAVNATQILSRDTTFRITVTNTGDCMTRDFALRGGITGADKIVAVSDDGSVSGNAIEWRLGNLAAGASRTVTVTANRSSDGPITDTATASAYCADTVKAAASTQYHGIPAVLVEVVDDVDPVPVGATSTYSIVVTNQGTAPDSDIVVVCYLEDGVEFVSAAGATEVSRSGKKLTFAALPRLAPKEVARWTVTVRGVVEADTRFKVNVETHESGRPIEETEATRVFKFNP